LAPALKVSLSDFTVTTLDAPIHLVDKSDSGNIVALHLSVDGDGLTLNCKSDVAEISKTGAHLHTTDSAEHQDRSVKDSQSSLDFDSKVDVT